MRGVIERLILDGRFGFIRGEDGREFFFHQTALSGTEFEELAAGSEVEFVAQEHAPGDERRSILERWGCAWPRADSRIGTRPRASCQSRRRKHLGRMPARPSVSKRAGRRLVPSSVVSMAGRATASSSARTEVP